MHNTSQFNKHKTYSKEMYHTMAARLVSFTYILSLVLASNCFVSALLCYDCREPSFHCSQNVSSWNKVKCGGACAYKYSGNIGLGAWAFYSRTSFE